jgi:phosphoribosylformylglycinamidine synthase
MNVAILRYPGTNCEFDSSIAFEKLGCNVTIIWHEETTIDNSIDLVVVPGGFSYGDYLRSGAIAKFSPISNELLRFAKSGKTIIGICNGFQILTEMNLLPGALKGNDSLNFISKFCNIKVINNSNSFLKMYEKNEILNIPVAHHDGNYHVDGDMLKSLYDNEQVLFKYCDKDGDNLNLNGSVDNIAGICNKEKNIFALMPHPERAMELSLGSIDGIKLLQGLIQ